MSDVDEQTRKLLEESVQAISRLPAGHPEGGLSAFKSLATGINRAKKGDTRRLLDPLEPKAPVLVFLVDLQEKKRLYAKQVGSVFEALVHVDSWRLAVRLNEPLLNRLPAELREALDAVPTPPPPPPAAEPPAPSPAPAPAPAAAAPPALQAGSAAAPAPALAAPPRGAAPTPTSPGAAPVPTASAVNLAVAHALERMGGSDGGVDGSPRALPAAACAPGSAAVQGSASYHLTLFSEATERMAGLGYSAAADVDEAMVAFEKLYTAVSKITRSASTEDDEALDRFEPKGELLRFLDDFEERRRLHRARVESVRSKLREFEGWRALMVPSPAARAAPPPSSAELLRAALAEAAAQRAAGVLQVRVIAAYGRPGKNNYACLCVAGREDQTTHTVRGSSDPRWDADAMFASVPSASSAASIEIRDPDLTGPPASVLPLDVRQLPLGPGRQKMRGAGGELEVEVAFKPVEGFRPPPRTPWDDGPAPAPAPAARPPAPGAARWVWWLTVDPHHGHPKPYPLEIARRLERAYQQREDSLDLGADFWGAEVHFRPRLVQKTTKGTRDVGRVELGSADATVAVFVVKHADPKVGWRSAEEGAEGAERRTLREADVMPNALSLSSVPL